MPRPGFEVVYVCSPTHERIPGIGFGEESINLLAIRTYCFSRLLKRALMGRETECLGRLTQARSDMIQLRFERPTGSVTHRDKVSHRSLASC
ncbi:hypothetical protein SB861_50040 [Paraburkholderia sp. SIMBA_049]